MFYEECTLEEILAYRELENEYFDFGEGMMRASDGKYSEDAYYEMRIQWEEDLILDEQFKDNPKHKQNNRLNNHKRKRLTKKRLHKLYNLFDTTYIRVRKPHKKRKYYSNRRALAKRRSNKKVRQCKSIGNYSNYRKKYDYWNTVM